MVTASWYHCSLKPVSRSAGRSVVAAAAYRLGQCLHDERYDITHDYTRRSGVESAFTALPIDSPEWARIPERLWNAAEQAEKRINSTLAREVELALPAFLSPDERRGIAEAYARELVERYNVAVSVAIHQPGKGDDRNYHAHILFTTREMTPDGLGKKTRILDDRKTGPQEVQKLRELAADIINQSLSAAHSDIRVDHRSFKERGIEREPTTHLGPSASEMERRGEPSSRGDINREAAQTNELMETRDTLTEAIAQEQERVSTPPRTAEDARERMRDDVAPLVQAIQQRGAVADIQSTDGMNWWQRAAKRITEKTKSIAMALAEKARYIWQARAPEPDKTPERGRDLEGGLER